MQRVNNTGQILHAYRYTAFGIEINANPNNTNMFRFNGEYWDAHRGEYYLRARAFNPRLGRFSQPDPYWTIHAGNMQFGTEPRHLNELTVNPLALQLGMSNPFSSLTPTIVPDVWAITQSGNLYVFGINNPVMFKIRVVNLLKLPLLLWLRL